MPLDIRTVYLRHNQRHIRLHPERRPIIDNQATALHNLRRKCPTHRRRCRNKRNINIIKRRASSLLNNQVSVKIRKPPTRRPTRCQSLDMSCRMLPSRQQVQRNATYGTRSTDYRQPKIRRRSRHSSTPKTLDRSALPRNTDAEPKHQAPKPNRGQPSGHPTP